MKRHKILYGVCGIGNGHTYRQLPIIESLAGDSTIIIFAYQSSLGLLQKHFAAQPNVRVVEVAVPYYPGNEAGLDFDAAAEHSQAADKDYVAVNARAMALADRLIGKPDLVVTDYEPVSAQYAYAHDAPLITIDQQSKYLGGIFPETIGGTYYADEVMRLRMFFPLADKRIACSFFNVVSKADGRTVAIVPPVLRSAITHSPVVGSRSIPRTILVYISAQAGYQQPLDEIYAVFGARPENEFKLFVPQTLQTADRPPENVKVYPHGSAEFDAALLNCAGLIATAGHGLLSEAMHLGIPVYALPLQLYEQQMNAAVIAENDFGVSAPAINGVVLAEFLNNLQRYRQNIVDDKTVLTRGDGTQVILDTLRAILD